MQQQQDIELKYQAPEEKFQEIFEDYQEEHKENMIFDTDELTSIYNELQKKKIYLTSYISQGGNGCVFEAKYNEEIVAVKCSKPKFEKIKEEEKIMKLLKDTPYVFKTIEEFLNEKKTKYYQISKKYSCNLKDIMQSFFDQKKTLPLNQIVGFAIQMSTVFEKIQQNNLIHSDIKPENILYDSQEKCFNLCDYGESKSFKDGSKTYNLKGFTRKYAAPEIKEDNGFFNIKYDIYGLGIILLELTLGKFLEDGDCAFIRNGKLPNYISKNALYQDINQIIIKMLEKTPQNRIDSFGLTKQLNELRIKLESQFIYAIKDKLDFTESNLMISKFRQSFLKFNYTSKQNEVRLDKYDFKGYSNLSKIQECIAKRLVHHLDLKFWFLFFCGASSENLPLLWSRPQCRSLTVDRDNNIDVLGASYLGSGLRKCINLKNLKLNLNKNQVKAIGQLALGYDLGKCANLSNLALNLDTQQINKQDAQSLGFYLAKKVNLQNLELNISNIKIDDKDAQVLGFFLADCTNLSNLTLYLGWNQISDQGASDLGSGLGKCLSLSNLTLYLNSNQIGAQGASDLGSGLGKCLNLSNLTLNLDSNQIGSQGASNLFSSLGKCLNLSNLTLQLNSNQIGVQGVLDLSSGLGKCVNLLNLTLNLNSNYINAQGASDLGSGLEKCVKLSNLKLNLQQKQFI